MSVRGEVEERLTRAEPERAAARLPRAMRPDRSSVRVLMLQRLAMQGAARGGALTGRGGAQTVSPFRLDLRQRVVVKALVSRHQGPSPGAALAKHVSYLHRSGAGLNGERGEFYGREGEDRLAAQPITREWAGDRHHFRFIVSPEHGDRIPDLKAYTREVMQRVAADLGEPKLEWVAINHFDTDQPHAHVLVRGLRGDGRDLVIPRAYIGYGFRARAQEVAQELLGDLSRTEAERRIWRETQADRLTRFDKMLLDKEAQQDGVVADGLGQGGSRAALLRGRLAHLEALGLAKRVRGGAVLDPNLADKLRALSDRRDVIRTLNQRRLEGAARVQEIGSARVSGDVVRAGYHDELGSRGYVFVRDPSGVEHYAQLRLGQPLPELGRQATMQAGQRGAGLDRERDLGRGR